MRVEMFVFLVSAAICLGGALGVVLFRNPVHNALSLVATLFGVAVLFVAQEAYFLAAIQVIVYAGAIVVLFLFVIMLLGVDRAERLGVDPIAGQRVAAVVCGVAVLGLSLTALLAAGERATGAPGSTAVPDPATTDVERLGEVIFTDYVFVFEITAVLLTVAVVGAVVLARRPGAPPIDLDEFPDGPAVTALDDWDDDRAEEVSEVVPDDDEADPSEGSAERAQTEEEVTG